MPRLPDLVAGDCRLTMAAYALAGELFDSCITDPPYHLKSMVKRFGKAGSAPPKHGRDGSYARLSKGFQGQTWDGGDIAFDPDTWRAVSDLLHPGGYVLAFGAPRTYHRLACAIEDAGFEVFDSVLWLFGQGWPKRKGLLKPAYEPICVGRKAGKITPLNTEACRVPSLGKPRWPANVMHDGSDDVLSVFPDSKGQLGRARTDKAPQPAGVYGARNSYTENPEPREDRGSAARFFWQPKATAADRAGSGHPTIKPVSLMRELCRLATPPGGRILDPFAGSGTTLQAAYEEGFDAVGCEQEPEYVLDIMNRLAAL